MPDSRTAPAHRLENFESEMELQKRIGEVFKQTNACRGFLLLCVSAHREGVQVVSATSGEIKEQVMETFLKESRGVMHRLAMNKLAGPFSQPASGATN